LIQSHEYNLSVTVEHTGLLDCNRTSHYHIITFKYFKSTKLNIIHT